MRGRQARRAEHRGHGVPPRGNRRGAQRAEWVTDRPPPVASDTGMTAGSRTVAPTVVIPPLLALVAMTLATFGDASLC